MSGFVTISESTGLFHLPLCFPLQHGGALHGAQLAFELSGPTDGPVIIVQGGISAGRHVTASEADPAPGWWEPIAGAGRAIDTKHCCVLGIDWLGGAGASTGPANTAQPGAFPAVTSVDQARATALLLDHLGVHQVSFVGASYGGMVALAFAALHPQRTRRVVAISAPHQSHPLATAWRSVQRQIVELGIRQGTESESLALARALAMTTYRSAAEFGVRFAGSPVRDGERLRFPVEGYLAARGADFASRFDAASFLCLSLAIDLHRIDPSQVHVPTTVVGVTSDQLVPLAQLRELTERLRGDARLVEIDSIYGHDAFLKETSRVSAIVRDALHAQVCS